MKVINLFSGPGAGKSTLASQIFADLKMKQLDVELVTEYAKDLVYEERSNILSKDQLYILAKQNRKLERLENKGIDYAVTDSPLLLSNVYNTMNDNYRGDPKLFRKTVKDLFFSYDNINILLKRDPSLKYKTKGRIHDYFEASEFDSIIEEMLYFDCIPYFTYEINKDNFDSLIERIIS